MGDITFMCPECNESLSVDESFAGQEGGCPHCGKQIVIPATTKTGAHHSNTAPCPFCGEEIMAAALKCKYCGKPIAGMKKCGPAQGVVQSKSPIETSTVNKREISTMGTRIFQMLVLALLAGNLFVTASLLVAQRHKNRFERVRAIDQENKIRAKIDLDLLEQYPQNLEAAMKEQRKRDQAVRKSSQEEQKRLDEIMSRVRTEVGR